MVTLWGSLLSPSAAQNQSAPALLQIFEARWDTIESRMVDVFVAGYGGMWLPSPSRADSGGLSVGYDVFDRFDLGKPRNETLYGTENAFRQLVKQSHKAHVRIYTDMILNHNGFRDQSTPGFVAAGDYPGFVTTLPNDVDGDFHGRFETDEERFRLAGLIDIAQEKNHQFIRHPVAPNPLNIPSGSVYDQPNPSNARFYPDRDLGGPTVFDPRFGQNVTLYNFNATAPLAGDAVPENAMGLLMRHLRWMVQEFDVDGFRYDAARHFPRWVLDYADQAVFLAKRTPLLNGQPDHVYSFSETGYDSYSFLQPFVRKDINPNNLSVVGGNRDALDFNLFGALRQNLSSNGLVNDWRNVVNASLDVNDDGFANNGSQGVAFPRSHDEFNAHLDNVAHAYLLMRPGNALVYMNANQFGPPSIREFPKDGRGDALGGLYGNTITRLVDIRNTHGRGNYIPRTPFADQKEMLIYEREKSALVVLSNRLDSGTDARTIQTAFAPGTPLIELTGNADDPTIDPTDVLPSLVVVQPNGTVNLRVPRNRTGSVEHGKGYLIYGVSGPQGQLSFLDGNGTPLTTVLPGGTPTPATNGTTRLNDLTVVTQDNFRVRLQTNAVNLLGTVRDRDADGDQALVRVDGGLNVNNSPGVDHVTPNTVAYGFEEFQTIRQPGFFQPDGNGLYEQLIDATQLSEGVHFITARAFRHRNPGTGGDGGPAVFTDFRKAIYVDRLPPESSIASFEPYGLPHQRDLIVRSDDLTANSVHVFLNLPAAVNDAAILGMVSGANATSRIDRDLFVYGFPNVKSGNNVVTTVTYELTGRYSIERNVGLSLQTGMGLGIGDLNHDNFYTVLDIAPLSGSFQDVLYSQNTKFNPAADANADGLVDNRDLFLLNGFLCAGGASSAVRQSYRDLVVRRGDVDQSGSTTAADIDHLFANLGPGTWLLDLNVDGVTDFQDVRVLVEDILGVPFGDSNLDGVVDGIDFGIWNANKSQTGTGWATGDFNGDRVTDQLDFEIWHGHRFTTGNGGIGSGSCLVPEPSSLWGLWLMAGLGLRRGPVSHKSIRKALTWGIDSQCTYQQDSTN